MPRQCGNRADAQADSERLTGPRIRERHPSSAHERAIARRVSSHVGCLAAIVGATGGCVAVSAFRPNAACAGAERKDRKDFFESSRAGVEPYERISRGRAGRRMNRHHNALGAAKRRETKRGPGRNYCTQAKAAHRVHALGFGSCGTDCVP